MVEDDLERFTQAQDEAAWSSGGQPAAPMIDTALLELRQGRKRSHWMWFVFPQLRGLGRSETAQYFGIASLGEARAYLAHPVLGPRLRACASAMLELEGLSATEVLGETDALKLRSSMTLFAIAEPDEPLFPAVLEKYFDGARDERTLDLLHVR